MVPPEKLEEILPSSCLEELALAYQVDANNQVRLCGKLVFLCLLHTLLNHKEITQRLLEEAYTQRTGQKADHSSFGKRLAVIKVAFFEAIFARLYTQLVPHQPEGVLRALRLRFVDATTVTLSAKLLHFGLLVGTCAKDKARRHIKSVVELQEGLPTLLHVCRDKRENADSVALGETMRRHTQPGDLWVFDKGCHGRQRLLDLHQAGAFFLTPHSQQNLRTVRLLWQAEPETLPTQAPAEGEPTWVVSRVEQAVFENSNQKQNATWEQMPLIVVYAQRFDVRTKTWKPWDLMTNLPLSDDAQHAGPYTFAELGELFRQRWDIEVFFKFVKQHLNFSHLTSRCENGITVLLYMSLIAALLLIWYKEQTRIDRGWRSVKSWLAFDLQSWLAQAFQEGFEALPRRARRPPRPLRR